MPGPTVRANPAGRVFFLKTRLGTVCFVLPEKRKNNSRFIARVRTPDLELEASAEALHRRAIKNLHRKGGLHPLLSAQASAYRNAVLGVA